MIVSGYELMGRVSASDRGGVWQARDTGLDRLVAVKEVTAPGGTDALRAEARVLAGLHDAHIVAVYDLVEQDGAAYLVEEWIDGASLATILRSHPRLTPLQALAVMRGALQGLATAHRQGVVHGDISPANILLDSSGTSKLVDFGLAASVGTESAESTGSTGTVGYAPPEVEAGAPRTLRGDVYSAGAVLRSLLGTPSDVAHLREILDRATDPGPERRYPDAAAFLAALDETAERVLGPAWWQAAGLGVLVTGITTTTLTELTDLTSGPATVETAAAPTPGVEQARVDRLAAAGGTFDPALDPAKADRQSAGSAEPAIPLPGASGTGGPIRSDRRLTRAQQIWTAVGVAAVVAVTAIIIAVTRTEESPTAGAQPTTAPTSTLESSSEEPTTSSTTTSSSGTRTPTPAPDLTPTPTPTSEPELTTAAPPVPVGAGFNGTYAGETFLLAILAGDPADYFAVGYSFGQATWTAVTTCAGDTCTAKVESSKGLQLVFTSADGQVWTMEPKIEPAYIQCHDTDDVVVATPDALTQRRFTTVASDQGRVTTIRLESTITAQETCPGTSAPLAYTTGGDLVLVA